MSPPAGTTGGVCELPPGARIDVLLIRGRAQSLHRLRERELVCAVRRDKVPFTQELSIPRPHGEPLEFDCRPTHSSLHMPIASIGQLHDRRVKKAIRYVATNSGKPGTWFDRAKQRRGNDESLGVSNATTRPGTSARSAEIERLRAIPLDDPCQLEEKSSRGRIRRAVSSVN